MPCSKKNIPEILEAEEYFNQVLPPRSGLTDFPPFFSDPLPGPPRGAVVGQPVDSGIGTGGIPSSGSNQSGDGVWYSWFGSGTGSGSAEDLFLDERHTTKLTSLPLGREMLAAQLNDLAEGLVSTGGNGRVTLGGGIVI